MARDLSKRFRFMTFITRFITTKDDWSQEVSTGQMAGTTGQKKSITGIKIRLDEAGAKNFDILYRVHKFDGKWTS